MLIICHSILFLLSFCLTAVDVNCPADVFTQSNSAQWINPTPINFPSPNSVQISYTINNQPITPVAFGQQQQQYNSFSSGIETTVSVRAFDPNTNLQATCIFVVSYGVVRCPPNVNTVGGTATARWNDPVPITSGFPIAVNSIVYTYNNGIVIPTTTTNGQRESNVFPAGTTVVTVTATNGNGNSASCTFSVLRGKYIHDYLYFYLVVLSFMT